MTNLLECPLGEKRRRVRIIANAFGERSVSKQMYALGACPREPAWNQDNALQETSPGEDPRGADRGTQATELGDEAKAEQISTHEISRSLILDLLGWSE